MIALDAVNQRFGKKTMVLASEGTARPWQMRADHRSSAGDEELGAEVQKT
jgi:DNA polymerase V